MRRYLRVLDDITDEPQNALAPKDDND
jgi:hypothetical protein